MSIHHIFATGKWKRSDIHKVTTNTMLGKSSFCIVHTDKGCISTELVISIYDKVEKNLVLRIETIQQELGKPEKEE